MGAIRLESDELRLDLAPDLGASVIGLWALSEGADPTPLLRPTPNANGPLESACFVMAPWCNRVDEARFEWRGRTIDLQPSFDDGSAIHGVFRDEPFRLLDRTPVSARLRAYVGPGHASRWPFPCSLTVLHEVIAGRWTCRLTLQNTGDEPMPCGLGLHPFFVRRDNMTVRAAVQGRYPAERQIPIGPSKPGPLCRRLTEGAPVTELEGVDDVFSGFTGTAGIAWANAAATNGHADAPMRTLAIELESSEQATHCVVFVHPDGRTVCLEPSTMTNNGYNLHAQGVPGADVHTLEPGGALELEVRCLLQRPTPETAQR